jgi:hypothetical protein
MEPELLDYFNAVGYPMGDKDLFEMCLDDPELEDLLGDTTIEEIHASIWSSQKKRDRSRHSNRSLS